MFSLFKKLFTSGSQFDPHRKCPECGSPLYEEATARLHDSACPNLDCPARIRRLITHWCSPEVMDISIAPDLITLLVQRGLANDVAELYRLKVRELAALEGMNPASAQQLFDALTASTKRDAWRLLFGLSIPHLAAPATQSLCRKFGSVDAVFAASADRLVQAEGVSETTAHSLVQWHSDPVNRRLLKRLFKAGLNFKS